jgi:hypothetical protein
MGDLVSLFRALVRTAQQNWPEVRTMSVVVPGRLPIDAHGDGAGAVEDIGGQERAVFGEDYRQSSGGALDLSPNRRRNICEKGNEPFQHRRVSEDGVT